MEAIQIRGQRVGDKRRILEQSDVFIGFATGLCEVPIRQRVFFGPLFQGFKVERVEFGRAVELAVGIGVKGGLSIFNAGKVELVTGEGDRLNLKSKLSQYVSLANIFSGGEIPELEIVAYEKEDIDKLMHFMING